MWQTPLFEVSMVLAVMSAATGARLRLSHGTYGRVELYYRGSWGTICDNSWRLNEGHVVCRELGFVNAEAVKTHAEYGQGSGYIHLFTCRGTESSIDSCSTRRYRYGSCSHGEDAGVICSQSGIYQVTLST